MRFFSKKKSGAAPVSSQESAVRCDDGQLSGASASGPQRGLTLIEVVIGLALVGIVVLTFAVSLHAAVAARRIKIQNMAYALADRQLAVLRHLDPSGISERTDGPLIGVLFARGGWKVVQDATAPSASNTLETTSDGSGLTALLPLPKNAYDDFTLTSDIKVLPGAPAGWRAGFLFRADDVNDAYRVYLTATALVLEKIEDGVVTELYADTRTISEDTWQTLEVVATGGSIELLLNGGSVTTLNDAAFTVGKAALAVWEGAAARFDDVAIGGVTWDMDTETPGGVPDGWERFGLSNLPGSAAGTLTVTELYGDAAFKRYDVKIQWEDTGTRSVTQTTHVSN